MHKPQNMAFMAYQHARQFVTRRKWLLMGCAFGRSCLPLLSGPIPAEAVAVCERRADTHVSVDEWDRCIVGLRQVSQPTQVQVHCIRFLGQLFALERGVWYSHGLNYILQVHRSSDSRAALCNLIRCIFGNPFRPVTFDPRWRSESAVALARTAYDTGNFSLLPILADALEEAGCDNTDVLTHCRDPNGVHVRGCWVVDGVLGKV